MKLALCMISCSQELFADATGLASEGVVEDVSLIALGNGCRLEVSSDHHFSSVHIRNTQANLGVVAALHEIWVMARVLPEPPDILCYIHDDLQILEAGWDRRVRSVFEHDPKCGLAGFGGSTALGGNEIYKVPYEVHQLGRRDFYSNMVGAEVHGTRTTKEMPIVFTDGQSMIVRRELLDKIGGWSWWPFEHIHHAYDYGIACMARRHGYGAWLVPCEVNHIGFQTASQPTYKDLADKYGGDAAVHDASHRFVYNEFRDVLPLRLR